MNEIESVLRRMIDNNKPRWRSATIRSAHKQLDEYEAKAKAFDEIKVYLQSTEDKLCDEETSSECWICPECRRKFEDLEGLNNHRVGEHRS